MNKKEKNERKAKLSEYVNLGNGRFKDHEIETLESLVENRDNLDGTTRKYSQSYKSFDSEGTYRVKEENTYTFHSGEEGIHIEHNTERHWDDGQNDIFHKEYDSGREILKNMKKVFGKSS